MEVKETVAIKEMLFLAPDDGSNRVKHDGGSQLNLALEKSISGC